MKQNTILQETKKILKVCRFEIILKFLISFLYRGTLLIVPIFWGKAIDFLTAGQFNDCYRIVLITLGVTIGYYISACLNQYIYYKLFNRMYRGYSKVLYNSVVNNSLYSLSRFKLGEFSNIVNNDIDIVVTFLSDAIIKIVRFLEFGIIFYYFYTIDHSIFFITILICIAMLGVLYFSRNRTQRLNQNRKQNLDRKFAITHEVFNNIKEIKGFYVFKNINDRVKYVCSDYLKANEQYNTFSTYIKQLVLGMIEIARYGLAIYGMYLCSVGKMELGTIIVIYTYYGKVIENYEVVGTMMIGFEDFRVSLGRLGKLLEFRSQDTPDEVLSERMHYGSITFQDVLYGNREDPILDHISLQIPAHSITVITGSAGSGKTGIFDLLMKLNRKHQGEVLIDGYPFEEIDDDTYYGLVSMVRKDPHFFDLSIKDNLMLVVGNFAKVKKLCEEMGIHKEILQLKNKYDTQINDSSEKISADLRMAIAITRVLLKDSKIMLFDEAISILDKKYQKIVLEMLQKYKADHTIVLISRDENVLEVADQIITLDNNKVKKIERKK